MSAKSFFGKLFLGTAPLEAVDSPVNGRITVLEDLLGRREMVVGNVEQSGVLVGKTWRSVLRRIPRAKQCLILGLGAGTLAGLTAETFPRAAITGLEIDPKVIELGKKYFGLEKIPGLKIIEANAFKAINDLRLANYDLILVDLYLGQEFPAQAGSREFLGKIKKHLTPGGVAIFNHLNYNRVHRQKADRFGQKLAEVFPVVKGVKVEYNKLFLASLEAKNEV